MILSATALGSAVRPIITANSHWIGDMLTRIEITTFGCCRNTVVPLEVPVAGLVGRNGVGKTTIMRAMEWLATSTTGPAGEDSIEAFGPPRAVKATFSIGSQQYLYEVARRPGSRTPDKPRRRIPQEKLTLTQPGGPSKVLFTREGEKVRTHSRAEPVRVGASAPSLTALASLLPRTDPLRKAIEPVRTYLNKVTYYPLEEPEDIPDFIEERQFRRWARRHKTGQRLDRSVLCRILYMFQREPDLFKEFLSLAGPQGIGLLDNIEVEKLPMPGTVDEAEDGDKVVPGLYIVSFHPGPGLGGHGKLVLYSALSAGTKRILRLLSALLFDRRSVMLVEQPEDCIHPGLLYKVLDILRTYSDRAQVVFSTHSLEVLSALRPNEVRLVEAPDGQTRCRALSPDEIRAAQRYLNEEGSLGDYIDSLDEE